MKACIVFVFDILLYAQQNNMERGHSKKKMLLQLLVFLLPTVYMKQAANKWIKMMEAYIQHVCDVFTKTTFESSIFRLPKNERIN